MLKESEELTYKNKEEILKLYLLLDEQEVVTNLNFNNVENGFWDIFGDSVNIDTVNTTATIDTTTEHDVIFTGSQILKLLPQIFTAFSSIILALYDKGTRTTYNVDENVINSNIIQISTMDTISVGEQFYFNGQAYTVEQVVV